MKRRWKILLTASVAVLAVVMALVMAHFHLKAEAAKVKAQLRAQGERLEIADWVPVAPADNSNGAPDSMRATVALSSTNFLGSIAMVRPGRARVAWKPPVLPTRDTPDLWPNLRADLEDRETALAGLRAALQKPALHFPINYEQGFTVPLPHLTRLKASSTALFSATLLDLHERRASQAFDDLRALVTLPTHWQKEPFMISQLVRCAIISIAANATWEALQYPDWQDEQLAELQFLWASLDVLSGLEPSLCMERAVVLTEYLKCRESLERLNSPGQLSGQSNPPDDLAELAQQMIDNPRETLTELLDRGPRRMSWKWWGSYRDEIWYLDWFQPQLAFSRQVATNRPFAQISDDLKNEMSRIGDPPRSFFLAALLSSAFDRYLQKVVTTEAQRRLVVTAIALERFRRQHGKLPENLASLVPRFLPSVPLDPMDGQPLRYRAAREGQFLLYSVGLDGKDDDGDPQPVNASATNFYWTNGKDWVWPMPASEEDVSHYHAELEKKRTKRGP